MTGKYLFELKTNRVHYKLEIRRNLTLIKGKSGSGKTTLVQKINDYKNIGKKSGIKLYCDANIELFFNTTDYKSKLSNLKNTIVFIDEDCDYVSTDDFSSALEGSDCYVVIISRKFLPNLPISVNEVYSLKSERKEKSVLINLYNRYEYMECFVKPDLVIVEDKKSGYEFMTELFKNTTVLSGEGNSTVASVVRKNHRNRNTTYVIVDGAAFGSFCSKLLSLGFQNLYLFTPESFEYLILNTKPFKRYFTEELTRTYNYCDSRKFLSWERYYTYLLSTVCREKFGFNYSKNNKLHRSLLSDTIIEDVRHLLYDIESVNF